MPTEELKECLLCRSNNLDLQHHFPQTVWSITCHGCGIRLMRCSRAALIKRWNTRPLESKLKAQGMREAAEICLSHNNSGEGSQCRSAILSAAEQMEKQ